MMNTPKWIGIVSNGLGGWRLWSKDEPGMGGRDYPDAQYILAAEHDRMMAEKGAEIAMLRAERDRWHADANLMLGFADLAYDVGACPTSSELLAARDRVVATISNAAFEDAARMVDCACECREAVLTANTRVERWTACGRDPCGALDAADIRAMKGERG